MAIEVLANKIRANTNIKRLKMQDLQSNISMDADDTTFMINSDKASLQSHIRFK